MEKATVIGLVLAVIAVGVGMTLKGASVMSLLNPAALLIIFVGTAATLFVGFQMSELKKFPKLMKILFKQQQLIEKKNWFAALWIGFPLHVVKVCLLWKLR